MKKIHFISFLTILSFNISANAQSISDYQLKTNVTDIQNPIKQLKQLEPKVFEYNKQGYSFLKLENGQHYGFLAEDVQKVFPELVKEKSVSYMQGKNRMRQAKIKTIDEKAFIPVLIASIKQQQAEIEALKLELMKVQQTAAK
ncbi:MAG: tail fiber domain-containing protein [Niabella sp.]